MEFFVYHCLLPQLVRPLSFHFTKTKTDTEELVFRLSLPEIIKIYHMSVVYSSVASETAVAATHAFGVVALNVFYTGWTEDQSHLLASYNMALPQLMVEETVYWYQTA